MWQLETDCVYLSIFIKFRISNPNKHNFVNKKMLLFLAPIPFWFHAIWPQCKIFADIFLHQRKTAYGKPIIVLQNRNKVCCEETEYFGTIMDYQTIFWTLVTFCQKFSKIWHLLMRSNDKNIIILEAQIMCRFLRTDFLRFWRSIISRVHFPWL